MGPLIDAAALHKVRAHVDDALALGATVRVGGAARPDLGPHFFEPTLLTGVTGKMRCTIEETFGPVAGLVRFKSETDALRLANDSRAGLAAYAFTRDLARSWRVSEGLEYGMVGMNTGLISTEVSPFGGVKESGIGREGSKYGIDEYLDLKAVFVQL